MFKIVILVSKIKTSFFNSVKLLFRFQHDDDEWVYTEEPHIGRRKEILQKYPQIKTLMGPDKDHTMAYIVLGEIALQMTIAKCISIYQLNWFLWFLITYSIGGVLNHSLGAAIHEIGHNLVFGHKYGSRNRILSIICNLPMIIPLAISYKKYHQDHHRWLGHETADVDVPLEIETKLFSHPIGRFFWLWLHPLFYAFRPFIKKPSATTYWELINIIIQMSFNVLIWKWLGLKGFAYLLGGTWLGLGPHPMAGHFISEHYLFTNNQATHSYYGPINMFIFNEGYHVEHHDFPYVCYKNLPKIRAIASEYYDQIPSHSSLCKVMWDFLTCKDSGPQAHMISSINRTQPQIYNTMESPRYTKSKDA